MTISVAKHILESGTIQVVSLASLRPLVIFGKSNFENLEILHEEKENIAI